MEVCCGETTAGGDVSWSLHHPGRSMRSPVLALRPWGRVVCASLTLSVRSAPSSWRGVDARQRVGGGRGAPRHTAAGCGDHAPSLKTGESMRQMH